VAQYVGILDGEGDTWGIRIPDFLGCHGGGATPEAALADAISALRELAAHYVDNDLPVPSPRAMEEVRRDKSADFDPERESIVMVPLLLDRARPVKANISIDAGTLEAIDEEAERRGLTRSSFMASAAVEKITTSVISSSKRTTHRSSKDTKLYAVRDKEGRFKDIQTYKRAHGSDIRGKGKSQSLRSKKKR
jgi:predicted RNase H-like HicB family nuclease